MHDTWRDGALPAKHPVLGVGLSTTSYGELLRLCCGWVERRRAWKRAGAEPGQSPPARYVCVTSVHGVISGRADLRFRSILNAADVATPDGMPLVWALRSFGHKRQKRVYGPHLMLGICGQAARLGHRVFLYGGRPETLADLELHLATRFPGLVVAGSFSPPFRPLTPEENSHVTTLIRESEAEIVFVGISTPKQEYWMARQRDHLAGTVMFGVGAAFDFHAGRVRQAPRWVQGAGLEWLFRLMMEPKRLWRRYLLVTPRFLPLWAMQKAGLLKYFDSEKPL